MAKRIKKSKNSILISILQIISFCLGCFFWWTIVGIPIGIIMVFVLACFCEYDEICSNCGGRVGEKDICYNCNEVLR
jgi:hypothetical protein